MYFLPGGGRSGARFAAGFRRWRSRWTVSHAVRFAVAAILLTAAVLKSHQLATEPVLGTGLLESRWFLVLVIEYECFLAFWTISGLFPRVAWCVSLGTFSLFAGFAAGKVIAGEASCGCFGAVAVNPWWTLSLDISLLGAIVSLGSRSETRMHGNDTFISTRFRCFMTIELVVGCAIAMVVASTGAFEAIASPDGVTLKGRSVVLEPERWVGHRFPLLGQIDVEANLARGEWIVVLYHDSCQECRHLLSAGSIAAGSWSAPRVPVVLVEVPPCATSSAVFAHWFGRAKFGSLDANWTWFIPTPACIALRDGDVQAVKLGSRNAKTGDRDDGAVASYLGSSMKKGKMSCLVRRI